MVTGRGHLAAERLDLPQRRCFRALRHSAASIRDRDLAVTQGQVQHMTIIQDRFLELAGRPTKVQVVF
jgi:hypothetical protein